jgi:AAA family ATP:ADP antiporter
MQAKIRPFQTVFSPTSVYPKAAWLYSANLFLLLTSYFLIRPLRDEIAMSLGTEHLPWLFTGSTVVMLLVVPVASICTRGSRFRISIHVYSVAMAIQFIFYLATLFVNANVILSSAFFIWISVYNLVVVSLFWSSVAHSIEKSNALHFYGLIAAGGTLGALVGPLLTTLLSGFFDKSSLMLASIICLVGAIALQVALGSAPHEKESGELKTKSWSSLFSEIKSIAISPKLLSIAVFMALYICMSGFIYFQQSISIPNHFISPSERIQYFASLDLLVNLLALIIQLFLTSKIYQWLAPKRVLVAVPLLVGCSFLLLGINSDAFVISITSVIHRVMHFSLLVPARESAYTEINTDNFYSSKTTIDTLLYRSSDAFFGWGFSGLFAYGLTVTQLMLMGLVISLAWSWSGYHMGKNFNVLQKSVT